MLPACLDSPRFDGFDGTRLAAGRHWWLCDDAQFDRTTEECLPHLKDTFSSGYGMTESGGLVSYAPNSLLKMDADCVGPPLPTIEVRIEREDGSPATEGEVGVICVRSPIVMVEYWGSESLRRRGVVRWTDVGSGRRTTGASRTVSCSWLRGFVTSSFEAGRTSIRPKSSDAWRVIQDVVEAAVYGRESGEFGQIVEAAVYLRRAQIYRVRRSAPIAQSVLHTSRSPKRW